jgi:hypothetical protein
VQRKRLPKQINLRDYFKVDRYAATSGFKVRHWAWQLSFRKLLRFYVTDDRDKRFGLDFSDLMMQIFSDPFKNPDKGGPMWSAAKYCAIKDVELHDVWWLRKQLERDPDVVAQMSRLYELEDTESRAEDLLPYETLATYAKRKGWRDDRDRMVIVNLSAPKELIQKDFSAWLEMRSKEYARGIPHRFTDADLKQWHRQRVLAYLDLDLFQRVFNVTIPNHILGELLFPDETDVDVTERVRKVVKPLAESLMADGVMDALDFASADEVHGENRRRFRAESLPE